MKNNEGKGLYEIGETLVLPCGCEIVVEVVGYSHYVHPDCISDNKVHGRVPGYEYKMREVNNVLPTM